MDDATNLGAPGVIPAIERATALIGVSMASDRRTCSLLRTLARTKPCGRLLELGTGTGLATAWILDGMDQHSTLESVDDDPHVLAVAKIHLGSDPRLTLHERDGDEFIRALVAKRKRFDFIFADTWPGKLRLLDETLGLLNPGALYIVDDMLPQPNWEDLNVDYDHPAAIRNLLATLEQRRDLQVTKMAWSTGLVLAVKKGDDN